MAAGSKRSARKRANRTGTGRYGAAHRRARAELAPFVASGLAKCARCGEPIEPGTSWDLGHDDRFPELYSGPEHAVCNRSAPHRNVTSRVWVLYLRSSAGFAVSAGP